MSFGWLVFMVERYMCVLALLHILALMLFWVDGSRRMRMLLVMCSCDRNRCMGVSFGGYGLNDGRLRFPFSLAAREDGGCRVCELCLLACVGDVFVWGCFASSVGVMRITSSLCERQQANSNMTRTHARTHAHTHTHMQYRPGAGRRQNPKPKP